MPVARLNGSFMGQCWTLHQKIDANTRVVSEHLLNRDGQTVTEADAKQTAMQRTRSQIAVEIGAGATLT